MKVLAPIILLLSFNIDIHSYGSDKNVTGYMGARNALSFNITPELCINKFFMNHMSHPGISVSFERATNLRNSIMLNAGIGSGIINQDGYSRFIDKRKNSLKDVFLFKGELEYKSMWVILSKSTYSFDMGSISPQGYYRRTGFSLQIIETTRTSFNHYNSSDSLVGISMKNPSKLYVYYYNIEYGVKRFLFGKVFINKSIAISLPLYFWQLKKKRNFDNPTDFHRENLRYYLSRAQRYTLSIGLGIAF